MNEPGIRHRYFPVENRWAFVSTVPLAGGMLDAAISNARQTQTKRLQGRKPGPITDAIRASIKALDEKRVQVFLESDGPNAERTVFKATTKVRPDRSFHFPDRTLN